MVVKKRPITPFRGNPKLTEHVKAKTERLLGWRSGQSTYDPKLDHQVAVKTPHLEEKATRTL